MFTFELGDMILLMISPTIQDAKQDAWIAHIIASLLGVFIVYIAIKVAQSFPELSFVQFSKKTFGRWLGIIIILLYFFQWITVIPIILVESANFINTILLPQTTTWLIYFLLIGLLIFMMYNGSLQTIGFLSEVFGPIILIVLFFFIALISKEFYVGNILPIYYDSGISSILRGVLSPLSYFSESVVMLVLIYFTSHEENKQVMKSALWGVTLSAMFSGIILISVLFTFGPNISADMLYPAFDMVSYIFVMEFIQNMEILAVLISVLSVFIKLSIYYFLVCYIIAQLLKTENLNKIALYIAPIIFIIAILIPNISFVLKYVNTFWIYFALNTTYTNVRYSAFILYDY